MTSWEQAFNACGIDNQRGEIPDFIASNSIDDLLQTNDKALDLRINLINDEQKSLHRTQ